MKSLILAGGTGTRLGSLTYATNKHLLPVGDKPMLMHGLDFLQQAGVDELLIITGPEAIGPFVSLLEHYPWWDRRVYYAAQAKPAGIADAIRYGKQFCGNESFLVLLGDNIIAAENVTSVRAALANPERLAHIWTVELPDVRHCGVLNIDDHGKPVSIEEKPQNPQTNLAITGCYIFDRSIWDMIGTLSPSHRGEYEVTDILRWYLEQHKLATHEYVGHWMDLGHSLQSYYTESLRLVS